MIHQEQGILRGACPVGGGHTLWHLANLKHHSLRNPSNKSHFPRHTIDVSLWPAAMVGPCEEFPFGISRLMGPLVMDGEGIV